MVAAPRIYNTGAVFDFSGFTTGDLWIALVSIHVIKVMQCTLHKLGHRIALLSWAECCLHRMPDRGPVR